LADSAEKDGFLSKFNFFWDLPVGGIEPEPALDLLFFEPESDC
jgi:hypothetical protein